jgi:hypothetical protein
MAAVERFIDSLKRRKILEAVDGLSRPMTKDAYELGRLSGIQQGLAIAEQLINEAIGEDEQTSKKSAVRVR